MEEKPVVPPQPENQKTGSRRSRKDEEGRDYQCGCGKRYLSYPALYTHIKTKHDGKQPEGTLKTGTTIIAKRAKIKLEDETLKQVYALFEQFTPQVILKMDESLKGSFPLSSRIKKDGVDKQVYEQYVAMTKQHEFKLTQHSCLDLALALFLINMGELVNDKVYEQFLIFAKIARACFYEHGEELYRAVFSKKDSGPFQLKQFSVQHIKYFPIVVDFMIRFYVPEVDSKEAKEANLSLMEIITYDFCGWLNKLKLTNIKVSLSRNVEIDYKPSIQVKVKTTPGKAQTPKELNGNEKQMKEQNDELSEQLSQNQELEDELENEYKNPSGSKEQEQIEPIQ